MRTPNTATRAKDRVIEWMRQHLRGRMAHAGLWDLAVIRAATGMGRKEASKDTGMGCQAERPVSQGALGRKMCVWMHSTPHHAYHSAVRVHPYGLRTCLAAAINEVRTRGESCGGEVTCVVRNCPVGLGSPVFDKLEAELAKAMLSLPATKVGGWVLARAQHRLNEYNERERSAA